MTRRRIVAILALVVVLVPATAAADSGQLADRLDATRQQLRRAESRLGELTDRVGDARTRLLASDRELATLRARLRSREAELADARARLQAARDRTETAAQRVARVGRRLERTRRRLEVRRRTLHRRVTDTYKHGGPVALGQALLGADDVGELGHQMYYVRSVMDHEQAVVDAVVAGAERVEELRAEAATTRERLAAEQRDLAQAVDRLATETRRQRALTAAIADERARRARLVADLESDRRAQQDVVEELQAQSRQLERELAASRWRAGAPGEGTFVWPAAGPKTSDFGMRHHPILGHERMHEGIDIGVGHGQAIVAAAPGRVHSAGWRGGYGLTTVIDHGGGVFSLYAHQSRATVTVGQVVAAGATIGAVGSTGASTGPHLHFEVRVDGVPQDPMRWY